MKVSGFSWEKVFPGLKTARLPQAAAAQRRGQRRPRVEMMASGELPPRGPRGRHRAGTRLPQGHRGLELSRSRPAPTLGLDTPPKAPQEPRPPPRARPVGPRLPKWLRPASASARRRPRGRAMRRSAGPTPSRGGRPACLLRISLGREASRVGWGWGGVRSPPPSPAGGGRKPLHTLAALAGWPRALHVLGGAPGTPFPQPDLPPLRQPSAPCRPCWTASPSPSGRAPVQESRVAPLSAPVPVPFSAPAALRNPSGLLHSP